MIKQAIKIITLLILLLIGSYVLASWYLLKQSIDSPVLAITTKESYPWLLPIVAEVYLDISDFDPNAATKYGMPIYNFIVAGYEGNSGLPQDKAILDLSQKYIDKGADINKRWHGLTPLMAAVLDNKPVMVRHLMSNKANLKTRIQRPGSPVNDMTALEFAKYLESDKKLDMGEIIKMLLVENK